MRLKLSIFLFNRRRIKRGEEKMKLNHDCIRKLLVYLEENLEVKANGLPEGLKLSHIEDDDLSEFTQEDIYYSARKLVEAKYIEVVSKEAAPRAMIIKEISWNGHDYLDSIRDPKVWNEIKNRTQDLSGIALEVVKSLAIDITKQMLGLGC